MSKDLVSEKKRDQKTEIESTGLKYFNDSKAFIEYSNDMDDIYKNISNDMDDIYKNIEEYNQNKKRKILIVFMI